MKIKIIIFLIIFIYIDFFCIANSTGSIKGTVMYVKGETLPEIRIILTDPSNKKFKMITESNEYGRYFLNKLKTGVYRLRFELEGFETIIKKNIKIFKEKINIIDVTLFEVEPKKVGCGCTLGVFNKYPPVKFKIFSISGKIIMSDMTPMPAVKVSVMDSKMNMVKSTLSNEKGSYILKKLLSGTYKVFFELEGFKKVKKKIILKKNTILNIRMKKKIPDIECFNIIGSPPKLYL